MLVLHQLNKVRRGGGWERRGSNEVPSRFELALAGGELRNGVTDKSISPPSPPFTSHSDSFASIIISVHYAN